MSHLIDRYLEIILPEQKHFDCFALGVIDFKNNHYRLWGDKTIFFDLASLTKPLALGGAALFYKDDMTTNLRMLLEHRGGLVSWGLLSKKSWKEHLKSFSIKDSPTLYSDYSAMRFKIDLEGKKKIQIHQWCDSEIYYWRERTNQPCVVTGMRGGEIICGDVHDPNAWVIEEFCGHAGLFSTIEGVCKTLINMNEKFDLLKFISSEVLPENRFVWGWDRVMNPKETLAGFGCSPSTFGHLGFTGTSIWIDPQSFKGHVILSNATRDGWFYKAGLNQMRKDLGELIWKSSVNDL